ncbi:hypothetical protein [Pseudogemmobacter sp. W21_MBD1_M6]|uniref:hypothetical protein n=1 Tax=Pseudogemmobacter sp. W21_MBD1_M6 TaxID=3240271 RepID=UPI003F9A46AE
MMIARWQFTAKFGRKQEAIDLIEEWNQQIGAQTNIDVSKARIVTGSVGVSEGLVENEMEINGLKDLDDFFSKIASIKMHGEWGPKMGEVIVSGSTRWEVFRVV